MHRHGWHIFEILVKCLFFWLKHFVPSVLTMQCLVKWSALLSDKMSSGICPSPFCLLADSDSYHLCVFMHLCKSFEVITASVGSFSDCFSSTHGHHSRKPITVGNTKSARPICYSIAKSETRMRAGVGCHLFTCWWNIMREWHERQWKKCNCYIWIKMYEFCIKGFEKRIQIL